MENSNTDTNTFDASSVELRALEQYFEEDDFFIPVNVGCAYDEFDPVADSLQPACA